MKPIVQDVDELIYQTDWVGWSGHDQKHVHMWSCKQWDSGAAPRANICIIHGLGEHGGRYGNLARTFVSAGFRVFSFDQQGHGRSREERGCIASYDALMDDIGGFLDWAGSVYQQPTVLFGHSMGGNLVLNYALRRDPLPAGVISSSPMIEAVRQPSGLYRLLARMLLLVAPNYRLHSKVFPERLMSDPAEQQALRDDELFHSQLSLRLGAALLDSGSWALRNAQRLRVPTLLTHGTNDCLTRPQATEAFANQAGDVCQLELLPGSLHDPFRGLEKDEINSMFVEFVNRLASDQSK